MVHETRFNYPTVFINNLIVHAYACVRAYLHSLVYGFVRMLCVPLYACLCGCSFIFMKLLTELTRVNQREAIARLIMRNSSGV